MSILWNANNWRRLWEKKCEGTHNVTLAMALIISQNSQMTDNVLLREGVHTNSKQYVISRCLFQYHIKRPTLRSCLKFGRSRVIY